MLGIGTHKCSMDSHEKPSHGTYQIITELLSSYTKQQQKNHKKNNNKKSNHILFLENKKNKNNKFHWKKTIETDKQWPIDSQCNKHAS